MKKKSPELLAPGGSFESAYYALSNGADAVYIGLKKYSARKSAKNFDTDQLRRLKAYADQNCRKIYVAMNTIMTDIDIEEAIETCALLEAMNINGLIVQDIGFSQVVRKYFPGLPLHASTQMGIHNSSGIDEIIKLGFKRVILARELSFRNIEKLREIHNDIEMEVFIHGALCYSVSGMCLASGMVLGRSGNKGECAQVCRNYYTRDGAFEYSFSCNDLALYEKILKYRDIGIDGFKIEGRMKSPEYTGSVVRFYRYILDADKPYDVPASEAMKRKIRTVFSRGETEGYFNNQSAENLVSPGFPGHKGILLGKAYNAGSSGFTIDLEDDITLRDGIQYFEENNIMQPVMGPILEIAVNGNARFKAKSGDTAFIKSSIAPHNNCAVYKISSRDMDLKKIRDAAFSLHFIPVSVLLVIQKEGFEFSLFLFGNTEVKHITVDIHKSRQKKDFSAVAKSVFRESAENMFRITEIAVDYKDGLEGCDVFVPPSQLKKARNELYDYINSLWLSNVQKRKETIFEFARHTVENQKKIDAENDKSNFFDLSLFSKRPFFNPDYLDYNLNENNIDEIPDWNAFKIIQIPPFLYDADEYFFKLKNSVAHYPDRMFLFGLQNISHMASYKSMDFSNNCYVFSDFFLYCANIFTYICLSSLKNCLFIYDYIEKRSIKCNSENERLLEGNIFSVKENPNMLENIDKSLLKKIAISKKFEPPLFYSVGCYHKHAINKGRCDENCTKKFQYTISGGGRKYRIVVNKCITCMIKYF